MLRLNGLRVMLASVMATNMVPLIYVLLAQPMHYQKWSTYGWISGVGGNVRLDGHSGVPTDVCQSRVCYVLYDQVSVVVRLETVECATRLTS